jgi:hypothetical protein
VTAIAGVMEPARVWAMIRRIVRYLADAELDEEVPPPWSANGRVAATMAQFFTLTFYTQCSSNSSESRNCFRSLPSVV